MCKLRSYILVIFTSLALAACSSSGSAAGSDSGGGATAGTTADTTAPTVSSTSPASGATSVALNATIAVTFSEPMQTGTVTNNGTTTCVGSVQVSTLAANFASCVNLGTSVASNSNQTFTFTPAANLAATTQYLIRVTTAVKDVAGNSLAAQFTLATAFTTGTAADTTAPTTGTAISFSSVSSTGLTVNWGAATDAVTAQASLEYKLVKDNTATTAIDTVGEADAKTGGDLLMDWTANATSNAVTGLSASTTYHFAVLVRDAAGNKALYTPQSQITSVAGTVAAPTFSPVAGTYTSAQNVTISTTTGSATICYRTDGIDPTAPTAGTCGAGSTTYGSAVNIASTTTLKAMATKAGSTNSSVTTGLFTIDLAPTAGAAISFTSVSATGLTVNWGAATDAITAQASLEYKLVKDNTAATGIDTVGEADAKTGSDLLVDWTANTTSKVLTGLSAATTYHFAVLVRDAVGNKTLYTPASQTTYTNVYPSYAFDTTGKSVYVVYTTNATNPTKVNGTSVTAAFDVFADPDRRFKAAIPTGAGVRFVFYVSNDTLANGFGRTTETNGYQTTWTEGDTYFTHTNTQVYTHYNYDTTGKSVYVVYTTNGTNPSKTNGTSVPGTFDYYDGATWRRFRGNIPSGANVKYVIYISNDILANGYGRTSSDGYLTSWTEGDSALTLPQ